MTGGIHEHHLARAVEKDRSPTIESDRPCGTCGYNLRGLPVDSRCPECGASVRRAKGADDPLSCWPPEVVMRFLPGCWLCAVSLIAALAMYLSDNFAHWKPGVVPAFLCLMSIIWLAGVWLATPEMEQPAATERGFTGRSLLRNASRWLQLFWPVAAFAMLGVQMTPSTKQATADTLSFLMTVAFLGGIVAIMVLSVLLARLAEWVRDDVAERAFNWTAWGTPLLSLALWGLLPFAGNRMGWALIVLWLICLGMFPWGLWSLSRSVSFAVYHAKEHEEQSQHRARRQRDYDEEVARNIPKRDATRERSTKR